MKKIFIGLSAIFAFAFGFTGCDTDYVTYSGPDYIMFSDTLTVLPVQNNEEYFDIPENRDGGFVMQGFSDILPRSDTECPQPLGFPRDRGRTFR